MAEVEIRKVSAITEEMRHEGGSETATPIRRAAVLAKLMTTGLWTQSRVGGLEAFEIRGEDGLR